MTATIPNDDLDELLAMLESAGSGLAILELPAGTAFTAPAASGVATFLPLAGTMYILRDGMPYRRVRTGELALIPADAKVRLSAGARPSMTIDSRERLEQRGSWVMVPVPTGEEALVRVAAARIIGSREAALADVVIADVKGCSVAGSLFRQLVEEVERGADGHAGFAMALMNACVVHVIRRDRGVRQGSSSARPKNSPVARAIAAIRAHPGDNHTIDSLARLAGMSRSSFLRGFTRATGAAPQRYLQQLRLGEAAALLSSTTLPVKTIAAATGFASRSHFSRAFREAYSLDPTAYRNNPDGKDVPDTAEEVPVRIITEQSSGSPDEHDCGEQRGNPALLQAGNDMEGHRPLPSGTTGVRERSNA